VATSTALHDLEVDYRGVELSNLHVTLHDTLRATLVSVRGGSGMGGECCVVGREYDAWG
jgi:hypothetical protein